MNDLTQYNDSELSNWVFNDETLYSYRNSSSLRDLLDEVFIYTEEQYSELLTDIEDDNQS